MGKVINIGDSNELVDSTGEFELIELAEQHMIDARNELSSKNVVSVPIAELLTLGAGVSSLIPTLNKVTATTTFSTKGLYRLANANEGDVLKTAKDNTFYGALKTSDGKSKLAKFKEEGYSSATTTGNLFNPATMMMAAALFSIEKELSNISEMEKKILQFLEIEKKAEIEADVETLMGIVTNYKLNWDNEYYVASNHKLVLDIQRTARKNMNVYQKTLKDSFKAKQFIVAQDKINATLSDLENKFQYYRLSLYTFSLASLMEVMLSGNFKEEYVARIRDEIKVMSEAYREVFSECSIRLENMSSAGLEANIVKGIGHAGKAVGKIIGNIPLVKDGPVDEFLQDKGSSIEENALNLEKKAVRNFAAISNPGTGIIVDKLEDIIQIYNHTSQIYFDKEKIYLVAN